MPNVLPFEKRLRVLAGLVDGNSERAVERMTGASLKTIRRFALQCGAGAQRLHDRVVRDLSISLVQFDEIWSYVQKKQARVTEADPPGVGEAYTFVAMCTNSRLVVAWHVGKRDEENTRIFMRDLRSRLVAMPKLMTSDGFTPYISAVGEFFGASSDYAQTIKNYRKSARKDDDYRYEPPRNPFIEKKAIYGAPDLEKASTAYIERNNGTMRHHIGRMRRLCLAFSKKIENHRAAVALNYVHYNFCHVVKTLRVTPAMQAGITDHIWSLEEFMEAILNEPEGGKPTPKPLAVRQPEGPARELPGGRGWLRLV
ncbi:transposase [Sorangium sp. So ce1389]